MTDEEVLEIAKGLTRDQWNLLKAAVWQVSHRYWYSDLINMGLVQRHGGIGIRLTVLGYQVLEWRPLFMEPMM